MGVCLQDPRQRTWDMTQSFMRGTSQQHLGWMEHRALNSTSNMSNAHVMQAACFVRSIRDTELYERQALLDGT